MAIERKKFSSQVKPEVLEAFKSYAENEGKQFQMVLEEAMLEYLESRDVEMQREDVISHLKASIAKNYPLGEILAEKRATYSVKHGAAPFRSNSMLTIDRERRETVIAVLKEFRSPLDLHKLSDPTEMVAEDREK